MLLLVFRIIFTIIWFCFTFLIGIIVGLFRPFNPQNIQIVARLMSLSRYILGIHLEIKNRDITKSHRPCVFISNHQDNLDIFPGAFTIPDNTVTIGKRSIIFIPFFGIFYWLSGNILINRKNKKSALETMDTAANIIREKNISVWIMPEGTRSKGRGVLPFKKGAFITAIKAQVPIIPIAISSYTHQLNFKKWNSGTILIEVLPPISTIGKTIEDTDQIKSEAFQLISGTVTKLDEEVKTRI